MRDEPPPLRKPFLVHLAARDRALFIRRLALMMRSRVPLLRALSMLADDARTASESYVYRSIVLHVSGGQSLSHAVEQFEYCFGKLCVHVIQVGEHSGTLQENLSYLADELLRRERVRSKVIGALVYPIVVLIATICIALGLVVYLIPKITPIFQSFHMPLPLVTRALIGTSLFLQSWGVWLVLGLVALMVAGMYLTRRYEPFQRVAQGILIHMPIIGTLVRLYTIASICRTMGILLRDNGKILEALDAAATNARLLRFRDALKKIAEHVRQGQSLSSQMKASGVFPSIVFQMVSVGEASGNLSESFLHVAELFENEIDDHTKHIATLVEPLLMIVMGIVVGVIALAIVTPIYHITQFLTPYH